MLPHYASMSGSSNEPTGHNRWKCMLVLIVIAATAAIPLMIVTNFGQP
jgi:hypothetical protein